MSTSLARQLKRLAVPETQIFKRNDKLRSSLLFDPKEAANLDRDVFFSIGINGLQELQTLDLNFRNFEDDLFGDTYKTMERTIQTKKVNLELDQRIKEFLIRLSPYFMLKPSLQALEWMIYRFHINVMNEHALLACILPYHETNYFVRVIQTMDFKHAIGSKWLWLKAIQTTGTVLSKVDLFKHASQDFSFLNFVCQMPQDHIKVFSTNRPLLQTVFAFYTTTVIGALNLTKVNEEVVATLAPYIEVGLKSDLDLYVTSSYMILTALAHRMRLKAKFWRSMTLIMAKNIKEKLFEHLVVCLVNIVNSQNCQPFSKNTIDHLCVENGSSFLGAMALLPDDCDLARFYETVADALVKSAFKNYHDHLRGEGTLKMSKKVWKGLLNLLKSTKLDPTSAHEIIRSLIDNFVLAYEDVITSSEGGEERKTRLAKLKESLGKTVNLLDKRYPVAMEKVLCQYLAKRDSATYLPRDRALVIKRAVKFFVKISTSPKYMVMDASKTTLHLSLNHPNPEIRKLAVETMLNTLSTGPDDGKSRDFALFAAQAIREKFLREDEITVLRCIFDALDAKKGTPDRPSLTFKAIFDLAYPGDVTANGRLASTLVDFLKAPKPSSSKKWLKLYAKALDTLVSIEGDWQRHVISQNFEAGDVTLEMLTLLVPYFFATPHTIYLVRKLSKSPVYQTFPFFQTLKKSEWRSLLSNKYNLNQANALLVESIAKDIAAIPDPGVQRSITVYLVQRISDQLLEPGSRGFATPNSRILYFVLTALVDEWLLNGAPNPDDNWSSGPVQLLRSLANPTLTCLATLREGDLRRPNLALSMTATLELSWRRVLGMGLTGAADENFVDIFVAKPATSTDDQDGALDSGVDIAAARNALLLLTTHQIVDYLNRPTLIPTSCRDNLGGDLSSIADEAGISYLGTLVMVFKVLLLKSIQASIKAKGSHSHHDSPNGFGALFKLFQSKTFGTKNSLVSFLCYATGCMSTQGLTSIKTCEFPYELATLKIVDITLRECKPMELTETVINLVLTKALGVQGLNSPNSESRRVALLILRHLASCTSTEALHYPLLRYIVDCEDLILRDRNSVLHIFSPDNMETGESEGDTWTSSLSKIAYSILDSPQYSVELKCQFLSACGEVDSEEFFVTACEPLIPRLYESLTQRSEDGENLSEADRLQKLLSVLLTKYSPSIASQLLIGSGRWDTFVRPLRDWSEGVGARIQDGLLDSRAVVAIVEKLLTQVTGPFFGALPSDKERLALCQIIVDTMASLNPHTLTGHSISPDQIALFDPKYHHRLAPKLTLVLREIDMGAAVLNRLLLRDVRLTSAVALLQTSTAPHESHEIGGSGPGFEPTIRPFSPSITKIRRLSAALTGGRKKAKQPLEFDGETPGPTVGDDDVVPDEWQPNPGRLVVTLEMACHQVPKMGPDKADLLQTLFTILDACCAGVYRSNAEYLKQLAMNLLSTILNTDPLPAGPLLEARFKVESVLACLRQSPDARTQISALDLLTQAAKKLGPASRSSLLHNAVSLFAFMGRGLAGRLGAEPLVDDERTFDVITRTLEALLPALLTSPVPPKPTGRHPSKRDKSAPKDDSPTEQAPPHLVTSFEIDALQVFTDAAPDIPSHRRSLLFQKLITTLVNASVEGLKTGAAEPGEEALQDPGLAYLPPRLNLLATLLLVPRDGEDGREYPFLTDLCVDVYNYFPRNHQIQACKELVDHILYIIGTEAADSQSHDSPDDPGNVSRRYTTYEPTEEISHTFKLYESHNVIPPPLPTTDPENNYSGKRLEMALAISHLISHVLDRGQLLKKVSKEEELLIRNLLTAMLKCQVILATCLEESFGTLLSQTTASASNDVKRTVMVKVLASVSQGLRGIMENVGSKHLLKSLINILSDSDGQNYASTLGQKTLELLAYALTSSLASPNTTLGKGQKQLYLHLLPVLGSLIQHFTLEYGAQSLGESGDHQNLSPKARRQLGVNAQLAVSNVKRITTLMSNTDARDDFEDVLHKILNAFMLYRPQLDDAGSNNTTTVPAPMGVFFAAALCLAELNYALGGTALLAHLNNVLPLTLTLVRKGREVLGQNTAAAAGNVHNDKTPLAGLQCGLSALGKYLSTPTLVGFLYPYIPDIITQVCLLSSTISTLSESPQASSTSPKTAIPSSHASKFSNLRLRLITIFQEIAGTGLETRLFLSAMTVAYPKLMAVASELSITKAYKDETTLWGWMHPYIKLLTDHISNAHAFNNSIANQTLLQNAFLEHYLGFDSSMADVITNGIPFDEALKVNHAIADALVLFAVKMSERDLKPFLLEVTEWANPGDNISHEAEVGRKVAAKLSLYFDLMLKLAIKLDVLFLLFVGPAFELGLRILKDLSRPKNDKVLSHVINSISKVFHQAIIVDDGTFLTKERFIALADLLVDQIEDMDESLAYDAKIDETLLPIITDLVCGLRDDACWKSINHSLLLKTKHANFKVRVSAIKLLHSIYRKCGEDYLILLPESTSYIAELLEDEDSTVEAECHKFIETLEKLLGEPLQKYF